MGAWDVVQSKDPWAVKASPSISAKEYLMSLKDKAQSTVKPLSDAAKEFFPAMARGATFQETEEPLAGSVVEPKLQKTARQAGEFIGKTAPFVASAMITGNPTTAAVTKAGLPMLADMAGGAATMATYGGAKNLATQGLPTTGEKVGKLAEDVGVNAVGGMGLGAANFLIGKVADFVGEKLPAGIYNSIVRVTKDQALKDIKQGDYELIGGELASLPGFTGTKQTMISKATKRIDQLQDQIDNTIAPIANQPLIKTSEVVKPLEALSKKYDGMPGFESQKAEVDVLIAKVRAKGDILKVGDVQDLKKNIWFEIKDPAFAKSLENNPLFARTQRLLGSGLRQELVKANPALAPLNAEEGIYLGARQALQEEIARDRGKLSESILAAPAYESIGTRVAQGAKALLSKDAKARAILSGGGRPASGVGLSDFLEKVRQKGKKQ